jgi:two-component system sensor histidine kinase PilS (NtrC family)
MGAGDKDWKKLEPSRHQVSWYLFLRVLVITLFLGGAIVYQIRRGSEHPTLAYLYLLIVFSYLQSLASVVLLPRLKRVVIFIQTQVVWDILFSAALVYFTGGIASPFSFVFILVIVSAGIFLSRKELLFVASASAILYGSLLDLQYFDYLPLLKGLPFPEEIIGRDVFYAVFLNVLAFLFTALLSGSLAERLRKSEAALEKRDIDYGELEELNRTILRNIGSGLMIINSRGQIRLFNAAAAKITGYRIEDVYNRDVRKIFSGFEVLNGNEFQIVHRGEGAFTGPSGEAQILGYATSLVKDPQEKTLGLLVTFQDLTVLKDLEGQLKRADRLAAVGQLASGMAHEIRNPLASISGSVQLLMEGEHVPPDERRLMGIVVREADRLSALLTDFLVFARPGKLELAEVDVSSLLDELADMVHADPRFSAIRIVREYPAGVRMLVGRRQFRQALLNLAINGAEAMEEGGVLRLGVDPADSAVYVEDTGPGIPESIREKIFDPFFTTKDRGTGLGLATVYTIVEAHHGIVQVSPGKTGGTRMTVRLPRN